MGGHGREDRESILYTSMASIHFDEKVYEEDCVCSIVGDGDE